MYDDLKKYYMFLNYLVTLNLFISSQQMFSMYLSCTGDFSQLLCQMKLFIRFACVVIIITEVRDCQRDSPNSPCLL